ncbi:hypothetical protein KFL_000120490 [Klebsormidium nitens]|uniref:CRAL-TRIO domain-containing protein n=1 Tax=Klebsormidium nitens TaxID=105231 RepID=A0A1Y1HKD2_KLENI|nr:hypothetical protein KFL_000120490 [Klebsormidium nitens]|eukprot:GAQ78403.1 hypothetical protein KFL_000120490 [Klebsormidium nitens]
MEELAASAAKVGPDPHTDAGRAPMPNTPAPALNAALESHVEGSRLSETEKKTLSQMRAAVIEQGALEEDFDNPSLVRFLKARDWNVKKASKLFMNHLNWRQEFVPHGYIRDEDIPNELAAEKLYLQGFDKLGRPLSLTMVRKHDAAKRNLEEFQRLLVYGSDKAIARMPPGVEQFVGLLDLTGIGYKNMDTGALRFLFDFLQGFYPERLGFLIMLNAPSAFGMVWKVVSPFIHQKTRDKLVFCNHKTLVDKVVPKYFELDQVPVEYGGTGKLVRIQDQKFPGWPPELPAYVKRAQASGKGPDIDSPFA